MTPRARIRAAFLILAVAIAFQACASAGSNGSATRDATTLTAAEFEDLSNQDLLTIIQRLRPQWLQARGGRTTSGQGVLGIIVNGMRQDGGPRALRNVRGSDVEEARFLNARDATTRYGTDMFVGAIEVTLRR
jgi:hypothetical protein